MTTQITAFLILIMFPFSSFATELSFSEIWQQAQSTSQKLKKSNIDQQISEVQYSRIKWHWTPNVYLRAGYMKTDNAGQSFFANMNQRAVTQSDFLPQTLNNPEDTSLTETTVGVAWPLYEGGKFKHLKKSSEQMLSAQKLFSMGHRHQVKSELLGSYANLLNYNESIDDFDKIINSMNRQLATYKVGKKRNPVGYSGLLGLKATLNKALAYKNFAKSQINKNYNQINKIVPNLKKQWSAKKQDTLSFVNKQVINTNNDSDSLFLAGQKHVAQALSHKAHSEKAVIKPSLGVFAENSQYSGDRDDANSTTYGAYLKWQLGWFSKGAYKEAHLKSRSQEISSKIQEDQETMAKNTLKVTIDNIEDSLTKIIENKKIMNEQLQVSQRLYKNGAINAIQLSTFYSNLVDMHYEIAKTVEQLISARTQLYLLTAKEEGN